MGEIAVATVEFDHIAVEGHVLVQHLRLLHVLWLLVLMYLGLLRGQLLEI